MDRRYSIAAALALVLLLVWLTNQAADPAGHGKGENPSARRDGIPGAVTGAETDGLRTAKASDRSGTETRATHAPERLHEFMLPPVEIDGLPLQAALAKLIAAYEDACLISGERPLRLKFTIPPDADARLTARLGNANLDSSIRLLAGLAGLTVRREGAEYLFDAPSATAGNGPHRLPVPPDFLSRLRHLTGNASDDPFEGPTDIFAALGMLSDPSTVSFDGSTLTAGDGRDHAILKALAAAMERDVPFYYMLTSRIVSIPADLDFQLPEENLDAAAMRSFMRDLSLQKGVELMTMPSITARPGEFANIEIISELIAPVDDSGESFETHETGIKAGITPTGIGFGQQLDVNFSAISGDIDPETGRAKLNVDASFTESAWSPDAAAHPLVDTRPDGSRVVMLVVPAMVDLTGRLLREPVE